MSRLFIGDSGGVARKVKRLFIGDSGGNARLIKRLFVGDSGGVARLVYQGKFTTSGTFTSSTSTSSVTVKGYDPTAYMLGLAVGSSLSPATLDDGHTLLVLAEGQGPGPFFETQISISGFSSDPGTGYFASITCNGITKLNTDFTYSYTGGVATWNVNTGSSGTGDLFSMPGSGTVNWTLTTYG
jgi:hypothetical protein